MACIHLYIWDTPRPDAVLVITCSLVTCHCPFAQTICPVFGDKFRDVITLCKVTAKKVETQELRKHLLAQNEWKNNVNVNDKRMNEKCFLSLKEFVRRSVHKVKNTAAGEDVIKNNSYVVANTYANRLVECCTSLTFYSLQIEWLKWLNTFFLFSLLWVFCPVWLTGCVAQVHVLVFFTRGRPRLRTCVCWICWVESVLFFFNLCLPKKNVWHPYTRCSTT